MKHDSTVRLLLTPQRFIHSSLCRAIVKAQVNPSNVIDILVHRTMKLEWTSCVYIYTTNWTIQVVDWSFSTDCRIMPFVKVDDIHVSTDHLYLLENCKKLYRVNDDRSIILLIWVVDQQLQPLEYLLAILGVLSND